MADPGESPGKGGRVDAGRAASSDSPAVPRKASLFKWLVVVTLGCVIAVALVVPYLPLVNRGHDFSELTAVHWMRSYVTAQAIRFSTDRDRGYADDLGALAKEGNINAVLAAAHGPQGTPAHGYRFQELKTLGGKPIDWKKDFALSATPARYGGAKRRTFVVSTRGVIYGKDFGQSGFIEDFPDDPEKAGWAALE